MSLSSNNGTNIYPFIFLGLFVLGILHFNAPPLIYQCRFFSISSCFSAAWNTFHLTSGNYSLVWYQPTLDFVLMVVRQEVQGSGLATRWQWQKSGCHRRLPPGLPHVSCASLLEALAVDSLEDSWCFPQQAFGSPYSGEWAPSAHLGWLPTKQVRDKESKIESNTSLTTYISQL